MQPIHKGSGSEVLGCVDLVLSAFSQGADLTSQLSKKHNKTKGEREYHEILLHSVLAQGSRQIQAHYNEGFARFGEVFSIGDGKPVLHLRETFKQD